MGPLHGIPMTMKDQFYVRGMETTMAYVGWIGTFEGQRGTGKETRVESELSRQLYLLVAVPIGKVSTYIPQAFFFLSFFKGGGKKRKKKKTPPKPCSPCISTLNTAQFRKLINSLLV